jgi:hypothetical protein
VTLTVSEPSTISIYLMSYDSNSRDTGITITDTDTNSELVAERRYSGSGLGAGVWARYLINGNVTITATNYSGLNSIINAIMFD